MIKRRENLSRDASKHNERGIKGHGFSGLHQISRQLPLKVPAKTAFCPQRRPSRIVSRRERPTRRSPLSGFHSPRGSIPSASNEGRCPANSRRNRTNLERFALGERIREPGLKGVMTIQLRTPFSFSQRLSRRGRSPTRKTKGPSGKRR
jgi:hypothetical protein